MNYLDLRQKYPKFIYEKFEYEFKENNLDIKFYYSIPLDHNFVHKILIENVPQLSTINYELLTNLIFHIGLSIVPTYWKSTCSPTIELRTEKCALSKEQLLFWKKLFLKGMGEYFYKNQIDFTPKDFLTISTSGSHLSTSPLVLSTDKDMVLVPIGGGKDSIVTIELLKNNYQVIPFVVNPVPVMYEVIKTAQLNNPVIVKSDIDTHILDMNQQGYLNGHIPLSAFYAFISLLAAALSGSGNVAFSNERSSNEGNTTYLGQEINHQYSKSLEFETDLNSYLISLISNINYFSFLRPLYELQITKLFSKYPQYFKVFSSCNQNFKLDKKWPATRGSERGVWYGKCPKCVSTALMLSCFLSKEKIIEIMGSYPPDQPINNETMQQLLGNSSVKPFECVLTRAEANAAYNAVELGQLLSSWMDNPNMPKEFEKILKGAL